MAALGFALSGLGPTAAGGAALRTAAAGALSLAFGGAPLGTLLIARRMSLMGDALSHGILLGAAIAFLVAGRDPLALVVGALAAALLVTGLASLLARTRRLPEDAAFAVVYLPALAAGVVLMSRKAGPEALEAMLFGAAGSLDRGGLILAAGAASASLIALALFIRGFVAESVDPGFSRMQGAGPRLHLLLMMLVALNLVAGFRAFGALMTVALMMIPAAAARFWARGWAGQAGGERRGPRHRGQGRGRAGRGEDPLRGRPVRRIGGFGGERRADRHAGGAAKTGGTRSARLTRRHDRHLRHHFRGQDPRHRAHRLSWRRQDHAVEPHTHRGPWQTLRRDRQRVR
jgi:zinc/manganese transport system permease protein